MYEKEAQCFSECDRNAIEGGPICDLKKLKHPQSLPAKCRNVSITLVCSISVQCQPYSVIWHIP